MPEKIINITMSEEQFETLIRHTRESVQDDTDDNESVKLLAKLIEIEETLADIAK